MARFETWVNRDLKKIMTAEDIRGTVFTLDNLGNLIGVRVFSDGVPVTLSGSVTGYCILADGTTVSVAGTRSGNTAYIILPQSAYAVPGMIRIAIKLTDGSAITTLAALIGSVAMSRTDNMITPSSQVITDWSQQIAADLQENRDVVAQSVKYGETQSLTDAQKQTARTNIAAASTGDISDLKSALALEADRSMIDMSGFKPGDYAPYKTWDNAGLTHEIHPGIIKINGTSTGGRLVSLLGNDSRYANATTPSENQLSQGPFNIVSGHKYRVSLKLVAGSVSDLSKMLLMVFGTDGTTVIETVDTGEESVFTSSVSQIGQLCYFTTKNTTWTNAVFVYEFKDVTDELEKQEELEEQFDDLEEQIENNYSKMKDVLSGTNDIGRLTIPCENTLVDKTTLTGEKIGNRILFNGTDPSTSRWFIYETFARGTKAPTYENYPAQYHSACGKFIVGHKYYLGCKVIDGSIEWTDQDQSNHHFYFDLRTQNDGQIASVNNGVWYCTAQPEMIALCNYQCVFTNTILELCIYDLTEIYGFEISYEGNYFVPDYFESQLSTAISKINTDINAGKTQNYGTDVESFVFITDVHWSANKKHSPALIKRILNNCPIKTVICGGDLIQGNAGTKANAVAEVMDFTNAIAEIPCYEYLSVYGNHDDNSNGGNNIDNCLTKDEQYNILYAPFSNMKNVHWSFEDDSLSWSRTDSIKNDYYVDHPKTKTRFLCMDWNNPMNGNRVTWAQKVLAMNDGYRVIVIYHGIYSNNDGTLEPEHTGIMTVIEPYKGKIVALITGHAHMDAVVDYFGDGSVPVVLTSCDTFREGREGFVEGTVTEQCFDVMVVDYLNSKIKITRIGRGSDREVNISLS